MKERGSRKGRAAAPGRRDTATINTKPTAGRGGGGRRHPSKLRGSDPNALSPLPSVRGWLGVVLTSRCWRYGAAGGDGGGPALCRSLISPGPQAGRQAGCCGSFPTVSPPTTSTASLHRHAQLKLCNLSIRPPPGTWWQHACRRFSSHRVSSPGLQLLHLPDDPTHCDFFFFCSRPISTASLLLEMEGRPVSPLASPTAGDLDEPSIPTKPQYWTPPV